MFLFPLLSCDWLVALHVSAGSVFFIKGVLIGLLVYFYGSCDWFVVIFHGRCDWLVAFFTGVAIGLPCYIYEPRA